MKRTLYLTTVILGPICGLFAGCDSSVQQTIITGLQGGTTTIAGALITAAFQTILNNNTTTTPAAWLDGVTSLVAMIF